MSYALSSQQFCNNPSTGWFIISPYSNPHVRHPRNSLYPDHHSLQLGITSYSLLPSSDKGLWPETRFPCPLMLPDLLRVTSNLHEIQISQSHISFLDNLDRLVSTEDKRWLEWPQGMWRRHFLLRENLELGTTVYKIRCWRLRQD